MSSNEWTRHVFKEEARFNRSCLKEGKSFHGNAGGPKADGMKQDDFAPCAENHVLEKVGRTRLGSFAGRRLKRAEANSYPSMLWDNPRPMYASFDATIPVRSPLAFTVRAAVRQWHEHTCVRLNLFPRTLSPNETAHIRFVARGG